MSAKPPNPRNKGKGKKPSKYAHVKSKVAAYIHPTEYAQREIGQLKALS